MKMKARWLEMLVLFALVPLAGLGAQHYLHQFLLPTLIALAALCLWLILQDPGFKRFRLVNSGNLPAALWRRRPAFIAGLCVSGILFFSFSDAHWFHLPTQETERWLILLVVYPLCSVIPQELIYRTFFFHRYKKIIPKKRTRAWLSALFFAWAHVIYGNWIAVAVAFGGGLLFAFTYAKSRSTLACVIEHSIWGLWLFSFGLGQYIDSGRL